MSDSSPLDQSHYEGMQSLLELERMVMPIMQRIQTCGLDCQKEMQTLKERADLARAVKAQFFPDLP